MKQANHKIRSICALLAFLLAVLFVVPAHAAGQLASSVYEVDRSSGMLTGIKAGTTVSELVANMDNDAGSLSVLDKHGSLLADGTVATGMTLRLTKGGAAVDRLTIVVTGELTVTIR